MKTLAEGWVIFERKCIASGIDHPGVLHNLRNAFMAGACASFTLLTDGTDGMSDEAAVHHIEKLYREIHGFPAISQQECPNPVTTSRSH